MDQRKERSHLLSHFLQTSLSSIKVDWAPISTVHRILQAGILGWVAMPSSRGSDPGIEPEFPMALALQADSLSNNSYQRSPFLNRTCFDYYLIEFLWISTDDGWVIKPGPLCSLNLAWILKGSANLRYYYLKSSCRTVPSSFVGSWDWTVISCSSVLLAIEIALTLRKPWDGFFWQNWQLFLGMYFYLLPPKCPRDTSSLRPRFVSQRPWGQS